MNEILSMLIYTRVLYPGSKRSSLEDAKRFIEQPKATIQQVYRALSLLAKKMDDIQAAVYKNSLKLGKRNDSVIYYDCTNYYFESEEECGLRQYGYSKESRLNPIVQMGLFTDKDGIPLAFCINPGNTTETTTLKPLVDKPREKFGISKVVVCTDLEDNAAEIIKMNGGRWIIEDCFRITKTEFEARPVFLRRDDRIKAHFLAVSGEGYIPTYTRGGSYQQSTWLCRL